MGRKDIEQLILTARSMVPVLHSRISFLCMIIIKRYGPMSRVVRNELMLTIFFTSGPSDYTLAQRCFNELRLLGSCCRKYIDILDLHPAAKGLFQ